MESLVTTFRNSHFKIHFLFERKQYQSIRYVMQIVLRSWLPVLFACSYFFQNETPILETLYFVANRRSNVQTFFC